MCSPTLLLDVLPSSSGWKRKPSKKWARSRQDTELHIADEVFLSSKTLMNLYQTTKLYFSGVIAVRTSDLTKYYLLCNKNTGNCIVKYASEHMALNRLSLCQFSTRLAYNWWAYLLSDQYLFVNFVWHVVLLFGSLGKTFWLNLYFMNRIVILSKNLYLL